MVLSHSISAIRARAKRPVYLNDSMGMKIMALDFDLESGNVSNQRILVDFRATGAEPDGLVTESVVLLFSFTIPR